MLSSSSVNHLKRLPSFQLCIFQFPLDCAPNKCITLTRTVTNTIQPTFTGTLDLPCTNNVALLKDTTILLINSGSLFPLYLQKSPVVWAAIQQPFLHHDFVLNIRQSNHPFSAVSLNPNNGFCAIANPIFSGRVQLFSQSRYNSSSNPLCKVLLRCIATPLGCLHCTLHKGQTTS